VGAWLSTECGRVVFQTSESMRVLWFRRLFTSSGFGRLKLWVSGDPKCGRLVLERLTAHLVFHRQAPPHLVLGV
jgi:hypothetical protein